MTPLPTLSVTPQARPSLFKQAVAWLLMATISTSSLAQAVGPIIRGPSGAPLTGYTANGTYVQNGVVVGNPHQQLHDLTNPTLWTTGAVSFSNSTDPSFAQPTIDQMMAALAPPVDPGGLYLGRLYLNPTNPYTTGAGVLSAPPSPTPETGATPPAGPLIDNHEHYTRALAHAQAMLDAGAAGGSSGGWRATDPALGNGTAYLAKTHVDSSPELRNLQFDSAPGKAVFQAAQTPTAGAVGYYAIQGEQAKIHLANIQLQNAALLGTAIFFSQQRLKMPENPAPTTDWEGNRSDPMASFEAALGSAPSVPSYGGANDFVVGYIQPDGQAHEFQLQHDQHFRQFQSQQNWNGGEWGSSTSGAELNNLLGQELNKAATQHQAGQQAAASINFDFFKEDRALFMQGLDLYRYVNKSDWALLNGLKNGQITPGHPDYERARALSQDAFRQAYAYHTEYETQFKHTKESAAYQAQQLDLKGYDSNQLFNQGLNLFDKKGDPEQERLLGMLQRGELKEDHPRYQEIRGLAEARYKVAYQKALEPPKKTSWLKQLVAVVIAAVVVYFTAGAASGWAGAALGAGTTATGAVATTVVTAAGVTTVSVAGVAATAIGSAVGAYAGAVVGAGIQTGSLSKALAAGENSLKGGVAGILVNTALAAAGVSAVDISSSLGMSEQVSKAVYNTISSSLTQSIAYGGSFGDALVNSATSNATTAVSAMGANAIASADLGRVGTEIAHAGLGCAVGVARSGGSEGCGAGAVGAVVAHAGAQRLDPAMGRTLSDSDVAFWGGVAGGAAAALVGGSNNVQTNFGIGQTTGQNAVENNYLTTRDLERALDALRSCNQGCDVLRNSLLRNEQQGGEQKQVGRLEDLCKANPQACASQVQDIGQALEALQKPETLALLGQQNVNALVARQVSDLGKAVEALQWGAAAEPTNRLIMQTAMAVGATALGGGVMLSVGRALMAACASGPAACMAASTELAVGVAETAGSVPTVGMTAASTAGMASRLATAASNATDVAQVVREARLVQLEAQAARNPEFVDVLRPADRLHILYGDAPGSGGHLWPGQPGKTVFPQSWTADKVVHEIGEIATNPNTRWYAQTGTGGAYTAAGNPAKWVAYETRDGVQIRVVFEPATGRVVTAFPDSNPIPTSYKVVN